VQLPMQRSALASFVGVDASAFPTAAGDAISARIDAVRAAH